MCSSTGDIKAAAWEADISSISELLDPDEDTLIWSEFFLDPSFPDKSLQTEFSYIILIKAYSWQGSCSKLK